MDVSVFFPEQYGNRYGQARAVCASCLGAEACRRMADWAERGQLASFVYGMYAGEPPAERVARRPH